MLERIQFIRSKLVVSLKQFHEHMLHLRPNTIGLFLLPFFIGLITMAQNAWVPGLFKDGYFYAALGRNAIEKGHWIIPHLSEHNFPDFFHHPPFVFMLEGLYFGLVGANWVTARMFSIIFAFITAVIVYKKIFKQYGQSLAFLSISLLMLIPPFFKKARFPNLDYPLTLCIYSSLFFFYQAIHQQDPKLKKYWFLSGLFFGLALLAKGPPAIFILVSMGVYILLNNLWKKLLSPIPWLALAFGSCFYLIWPLLLALKGESEHFWGYLQASVMGTIVEGRTGANGHLFTYVLFLLEDAAPFFLLGIAGLILFFLKFKEQKNSLISLAASIFLAIMISSAFFQWKYSHYILPIYPGMAILGAYFIYDRMNYFFNYYYFGLKYLSALACIILLIFPITTQVRRDKEPIGAPERFARGETFQTQVHGLAQMRFVSWHRFMNKAGRRSQFFGQIVKRKYNGSRRHSKGPIPRIGSHQHQIFLHYTGTQLQWTILPIIQAMRLLCRHHGDTVGTCIVRIHVRVLSR